MNQIYTLPVDISQDCHIYSHMTSHWRRLSWIHHMYQVTLPVDIPQSFHLHSCITPHWRCLSQINPLHQVTLPVYLHPIFLSQTQLQCSINTSKRIKQPFMSSLPASLMCLKPHPSNWSHPSYFSMLMLLNISMTYLILMINFLILIHSLSRTSRA